MKVIKGDVILDGLNFREIPEILKDVSIEGSLSLYSNNLRSLKNCPKKIIRHLNVANRLPPSAGAAGLRGVPSLTRFCACSIAVSLTPFHFVYFSFIKSSVT